MKIINVVGARPNFMKIAPLMAAYRDSPRLRPLLLHTGQHYDAAMSELFFEQLGIPSPDINLGVGSGSHAQQTAEIMSRFEPVCLAEKPDLVLVVGDVNSTVACSLVAAKLHIPVAHVEAGLRSFDRSMPEEINRIVTDSISSLHYASEPSGVQNLAAEGIRGEGVQLVGNVMIDTLLEHRKRAESSTVLEELGVGAGPYAVLTLHRPANVDDAGAFRSIVGALEQLARDLPVVFPVHPRTALKAKAHGLYDALSKTPGLILVEPLGYLDFLRLCSRARVLITDSGGIQEESAVLKVPCVTLRKNTERPVTCEVGANELAGNDPAAIVAACQRALSKDPATIRVPELWDGNAAKRIAAHLGRL